MHVPPVMLLFLFIFSLYVVANGQITSNINDIICSKFQNDCIVDCTDKSIHCHGIDIYSSTNTTIINCQQHSSCSNIRVHCENTDQCILKCSDDSCSNSTLLCSTNSNNDICECQGTGCPFPVITNTVNMNTNPDDNKYTVHRSLIIMFFIAFFAVVLCCLCVLLVALCMGVLYFAEKNKKTTLSRQVREQKHRTISSFVSSSTPKSETTLNIHRMTLSRSNRNRSYDTTVSAMVTDEVDEKEIMVHIGSVPTTDDIVTFKQRGTRLRESGTVTEEDKDQEESLQQEGNKPQLEKFDSEDLYIMQHSTLQYPTKKEDDMRSNDETSSVSSVYSMDGQNTSNRNKPCHIIINTHDVDVDMDIGNEEHDITVDISAQLPTSPNISDIVDGIQHDITKHPPKASLLRPPTIGQDIIISPTYHGTQNSDAGSDGSDKSIESDYTTSIESNIEGMNDKSQRKTHTNSLQVLPGTLKGIRTTSASYTTFATYHESEDYKYHHLNPLRISRSSPPPQSRSISRSTDLQSESTFTIKSALGTGHHSDLSQASISLSSAAAVRIAFPDGYGWHHNIPFGISSVPNYKHRNYTAKTKHRNHTANTKHRNFYSEQLHNSKRNKLSMTPSNSPMEKPMIISKAPSTTAMVPSLPSSPTPTYDDDDKYHKKRHQSVPSYTNTHDHTIILMEPHIFNRNHDDHKRYRPSSKSTGNILSMSNNLRKIEIKRNSKPIIKVYRDASSKSNIVLPTNDFNTNAMPKLNEDTVEWNTTIMMSPPPPPIVLEYDVNNNNKRTRNKIERVNTKYLLDASSAAISPSPSSFVVNIIK